MNRVYSGELLRVSKYMDQGGKRKKYKDLQNSVKLFFQQARYRQELSGCVQSVFSRADSDENQPIKSDKKIAIKLHKWRNDPRDTKIYQPGDIHDIAAASVICYYPSDLEKLVDFIKVIGGTADFSFREPDYRDPQKSAGYSAYHVVVDGAGRFAGLKCELQLKTILTQAWGTKTHDLTYKPAGSIDQRLTIHMQKLAQTLNLLDEQSELLKQLITDAWLLDVKRRKSARMAMIFQLKSEPCERTVNILHFFNAHESELATRELEDAIVGEFESMLDAYQVEKGYGANYCRLMAIFALNRDYADLNDRALDALDSWRDEISLAVPSSGTGVSERSIVIQRSVTAMALGEYDEAINDGTWILDSFKKEHDELGIIKASANLAYFQSEACYHRHYDEAIGGGLVDATASFKCGTDALQLIDEIEGKSLPDEVLGPIIDTLGAVRICCGESADVVRCGLKICARARDAALGSDAEGVTQAFYDLHEKRAFRRILELS